MKNRGNKILLDKRGELSKCACFNLRKAARVVTQIYEEKLRPCGLKGTQLTVLIVAGMSDSTPITKLAEMLVMERTTLTRNLKPLEKQGLLRIDSGRDQRTRVVTVTEQGYKVMETALPLWEDAQAYVTKQLGQNKFDELLGNLHDTIALGKAR